MGEKTRTHQVSIKSFLDFVICSFIHSANIYLIFTMCKVEGPSLVCKQSWDQNSGLLIPGAVLFSPQNLINQHID